MFTKLLLSFIVFIVSCSSTTTTASFNFDFFSFYYWGGVDIFGSCRGCANDFILMDQVSTRRRRLLHDHDHDDDGMSVMMHQDGGCTNCTIKNECEQNDGKISCTLKIYGVDFDSLLGSMKEMDSGTTSEPMMEWMANDDYMALQGENNNDDNDNNDALLVAVSVLATLLAVSLVANIYLCHSLKTKAHISVEMDQTATNA